MLKHGAAFFLARIAGCFLGGDGGSGGEEVRSPYLILHDFKQLPSNLVVRLYQRSVPVSRVKLRSMKSTLMPFLLSSFTIYFYALTLDFTPSKYEYFDL